MAIEELMQLATCMHSDQWPNNFVHVVDVPYFGVAIGKKRQLFPGDGIEFEIAVWSSRMDDDFPLKIAVDQAWSVYLATHKDIDVGDPRRCSLERYLSGKWRAGESDPEELTCQGLSYLHRLQSESW